jgi:catechol 2,3-dioxygenase-like lactoylglutathione lyase family enzyme
MRSALLLVCLLLAPPALRAISPPPPTDPATPVAAVDTVGMTVSNMDRALDFYTGALPFRKEYDVEVAGRSWEQLEGVFGARMRVVGLQLGDERLELTEYLTPKGRAIPADSRGNDRWFQHVAIIVRDMDRAYAHLRAHGIAHASTGPQRLPDWNPGAGGIQAFYFRDPDGHFLEILSFPPGKGDPKWHRASAGGDDLFLGLDHTAIVVGDTDASLAFYRDVLGLRVAGEGENYGIEQEHLNNVFGVRLRITTLRAARGTGVELLEYRAPRDGRPTPVDLKANDLAHWQITMQATSAPAAASGPAAASAAAAAAPASASAAAGSSLRHLLRPSTRFALVSPDVTTIDGATPLGFSRGLLVRDPDGHAVRVVEP